MPKPAAPKSPLAVVESRPLAEGEDSWAWKGVEEKAAAASAAAIERAARHTKRWGELAKLQVRPRKPQRREQLRRDNPDGLSAGLR